MYDELMDNYSRSLIRQALIKHHGVKANAARELGIKRTRMYSLIKSLGMNPSRHGYAELIRIYQSPPEVKKTITTKSLFAVLGASDTDLENFDQLGKVEKQGWADYLYKKIAWKCHPDLHPKGEREEFEQIMSALNMAYEIITKRLNKRLQWVA